MMRWRWVQTIGGLLVVLGLLMPGTSAADIDVCPVMANSAYPGAVSTCPGGTGSVSGGGTPSAPSGSLQSNAGGGLFGAYAGSACSAGQYASALSAGGSATCSAPPGTPSGAASTLQMNNAGAFGAATAATFSTSLTGPLDIGGTTASSTKTIQSTSGAGTTDAILFKVGNNGATEAGRFTTLGRLGLGLTDPQAVLHILTTTSGNGTATRQENAVDQAGTSSASTTSNLQGYYTGLNPTSPFDAVQSVNWARLIYGQDRAGAINSNAEGTATALTAVTYVRGNKVQNSEHTAGYFGMSYDIGTGYDPTTPPIGQTAGFPGSAFAVIDVNLQGPIAVQPGLLNAGIFYINNYYNGLPSRGGQLSSGVSILTGPGGGGTIDATHVAATTYAVARGLHVTGQATGAGNGYTIGIEVGGVPGNWSGTITTPKIGTGLHLRDYVTGALLIDNKYSGATPYAISVAAGAGDVAIGHAAPTSMLHLAGTYTTTASYASQIVPTLASSNTTQQAGLNVSTGFAPTGASLSQIWGLVASPVVSGSSLTINQAYGISASISTNSGFTGVVSTAAAFQTASPTVGGGALSLASYHQFLGQAITTNGSGITTGTVSNWGVRIRPFTAAPGSGGTVNNRAADFAVPTGSPGSGGTALNVGVLISGVGGVGAGTITNYAIYNDSTAKNYFTASLQVEGPATQTIAATDTITADACNSTKQVTAASGVTTNTTDTFTAPSATVGSGNRGCRMMVCNVGATNTITLDKNAHFFTLTGTDVLLLANSCVEVTSDGTQWRQATAVLTAT